MASLNHIASVFPEYKYDKNVGFEGVNGIPCLACVSNLDRDVSCKCVWGNEPDSCVFCDHYETKCGSMPPQLLGVAQWYWNFVKALAARDPVGESYPIVEQPHLTERQLWRFSVALDDCGAAWRELEGHLMDPNNFAIVALQDLASTREIMTVSALQSSNKRTSQAGANISYDELHERIVASQPAYTRSDNCVVTLRDALARLSVAENTVVQSVPELDCDGLPCEFPSELQSAMWKWRSSPAPRLVVVYNGMPASLGQI
ncbi:hypothetical protein FPCIR_5227 [Fusarium pseudocircinatum]|uniref:Uncharacterized protein n=1 Tax=Fusarium pseudocircinatum TaxID=56676 RepID=A0A8H5PBP3_9HYPO|nr:hypothetical protein FPCIR_5227 [Fusarium pseudocircinatum]